MIKKFLFIYFMAVTLLAPLVFLVPAHAEPPHCFLKSLKQDAAFQVADCGKAEYTAPIQVFDSGGPHDDKCYLLSPGAYLLSVDVRPYSADPNSDCGKWLVAAGVTGLTPAKCTVIDGSVGDWDAGKIKDLTKIHPDAKCDDYAPKIQASGQVPHIDPGNCYLIFNDNGKFGYTQATCGLAFEQLVSRQQKTPTATGQGTVNVTRNDAANCDGQNGKLEDCFKNHNPLVGRLNQVMNFLSAGVGIIVVVMVIIGGLQYTAAGNNPQAVTAAKKKISNALIAFVAFMLLYSFMQWLIPGGPF